MRWQPWVNRQVPTYTVGGTAGMTCSRARSDVQEIRNAALEECATNLADWYPDNASTNAFCAAIRSMKRL